MLMLIYKFTLKLNTLKYVRIVYMIECWLFCDNMFLDHLNCVMFLENILWDSVEELWFLEGEGGDQSQTFPQVAGF
jgi:hypothetical protein